MGYVIVSNKAVIGFSEGAIDPGAGAELVEAPDTVSPDNYFGVTVADGVCVRDVAAARAKRVAAINKGQLSDDEKAVRLAEVEAMTNWADIVGARKV